MKKVEDLIVWALIVALLLPAAVIAFTVVGSWVAESAF